MNQPIGTCAVRLVEMFSRNGFDGSAFFLPDDVMCVINACQRWYFRPNLAHFAERWDVPVDPSWPGSARVDAAHTGSQPPSQSICLVTCPFHLYIRPYYWHDWCIQSLFSFHLKGPRQWKACTISVPNAGQITTRYFNILPPDLRMVLWTALPTVASKPFVLHNQIKAPHPRPNTLYNWLFLPLHWNTEHIPAGGWRSKLEQSPWCQRVNAAALITNQM